MDCVNLDSALLAGCLLTTMMSGCRPNEEQLALFEQLDESYMDRLWRSCIDDATGQRTKDHHPTEGMIYKDLLRGAGEVSEERPDVQKAATQPWVY